MFSWTNRYGVSLHIIRGTSHSRRPVNQIEKFNWLLFIRNRTNVNGTIDFAEKPHMHTYASIYEFQCVQFCCWFGYFRIDFLFETSHLAVQPCLQEEEEKNSALVEHSIVPLVACVLIACRKTARRRRRRAHAWHDRTDDYGMTFVLKVTSFGFRIKLIRKHIIFRVFFH